MRTLLAATAFFGLVGVASSAAAPQYKFAFTVRIDDSSPVALNLSVPPGTSHLLQATEHLKVEIEAPTSISDTSTTIVKLIDDSSGKPVVLHTARRPGPIGVVRTFSYAVCGGKVTFESPLQTDPLKCEK
jgi:hypothetical protein